MVFLLDARDVADANTLMDGLPLSKEGLMDYEYIPVGPLMPLKALLRNQARRTDQLEGFRQVRR